jgi:hypothetical protein
MWWRRWACRRRLCRRGWRSGTAHGCDESSSGSKRRGSKAGNSGPSGMSATDPQTRAETMPFPLSPNETTVFNPFDVTVLTWFRTSLCVVFSARLFACELRLWDRSIASAVAVYIDYGERQDETWWCAKLGRFGLVHGASLRSIALRVRVRLQLQLR